MTKVYGTWREFMIEQLAEEEDMSGYLSAIMEEYQSHGNVAVIQTALESIVTAKGGITEVAKKFHIDIHVLSDVLTSTEAPRIDTLRTILNALGCCLSITPLENVETHINVVDDAPIETSIQPIDAIR